MLNIIVIIAGISLINATLWATFAWFKKKH